MFIDSVERLGLIHPGLCKYLDQLQDIKGQEHSDRPGTVVSLNGNTEELHLIPFGK